LFNFKISGIAAGAAFVISIVVGLFSGAGILVLLLRAFLFGVVFFALSCLIFWLLAQYIPELLGGSDDDLGFPVSGSRVDISLGDGPVSGAFPLDSSESVDDIAGRPSAPPRAAPLPLDQERNEGYNIAGEIGAELEDAGYGQGFGSGFGGIAGRAASGDTLPDMDSLTEPTPGSAADVVNTGEIGYNSSEPRRPKSTSRKSEMAGDFNPKELAQAIKTVLNKDEKG
jgi:hypothetical protein